MMRSKCFIFVLTHVDKVELVSIGINLIALDIILMLKVH